MAAKQRNKQSKQQQQQSKDTAAKKQKHAKSGTFKTSSHKSTHSSKLFIFFCVTVTIAATGVFVYWNIYSKPSNVDFNNTDSDFHEHNKTEQETQSKYNVKYSLDSIDRRSNLSLEEYREVYDGKW